MKIRLQGQPVEILLLLLQRPGEVVTREELQKKLWSADTFVDFEQGLNNAMKRLRATLDDNAETPRFIETVPRKGYRFIGAVNERLAGRKFEPPTPVEVVGDNAKRDLGTWAWVARSLLIFGTLVLLAVAAFVIHGKVFSRKPVLQRSLTRLTFDDGLQIGASWSPDGRYIAYSSDRGGKFDIWVQQVSGGDPVQVTKGPGHNWQPDWSPDGKYIAYRSEEREGGIYVVPALGGTGLERKIAPFGYHPRWSPDSSQVLIQTSDIDAASRFYIAQRDGSPPREVLAEFLAQKKVSGAAVAWHPDGKRITVWIGDSSPTPSFSTVTIAGDLGIKLEISPAVQRELAQASGDAKTGEQLGEYSFSWSPSGDAIYFERGYRGAKNIWKMTVDPGTARATRIDRLTTGPGPDAALAVSADGRRLAFTAKSQRIRTWLFPFDATNGQLTGTGNAITSPGRTSVEPALSRDGTKVAYYVPHGESNGPGFLDVRNEVWLKSLVDGRDAPVIADDDYSRWFPLWSPDGTQLLYERRNRGTNERQTVVWSSQGHEEEPLTGLSNTPGLVCDWSRDGKWLLLCGDDRIWLVKFPTSPHAKTVVQNIISHPTYTLYQPHLSPNGRWIVFEAVANTPNQESALYTTPASGGPWTRITDGKHWDDKPRWSPDGKIIYFVSGPGGFFNVWGMHFDPAAGKIIGPPFQVSKFESTRLMIPRWIPPVGLSLTQDKLVLTMAEVSGSIWMLDAIDQ